jgi:hypothetical protein
VRRVLVEIDEDALAALFLPPRVGDEVGAAACELARYRHSRGADLDRRPPGLESDVDVDAAIARRLRPTLDAHLVEERSHLVCGSACLVEPDARLGIEVDPELVGVWNPRHPRFTAQATCARSAATRARDVVPFGVLTTFVSSQSGASFGTRFWKNDEPSTPGG